MEKNKQETSFTYGDVRNCTVVLLSISVAYKILYLILSFVADSDVDLGTSSLYFKDAYIDSFYSFFEIMNFIEWIALFFLVVWLITVADVAHKNTEVEMKYGTFSTIGYWFIPIMNLYKPYDVYKEIWEVSSDPNDSMSLLKKSKSWFLVFAFVIFIYALLRAFARQMDEAIPGEYLLFSIVEFFRIVWYISIIRCIIELSKRQIDKWNVKDIKF